MMGLWPYAVTGVTAVVVILLATRWVRAFAQVTPIDQEAGDHGSERQDSGDSA